MGGAVISDRERASFYKSLAECYYPPGESLAKTLGDLGKAAGEFLSEVVRNAPRADDLERHTVDYSRLFLGPFKVLAPPYGSVYLENGRFMGESTLDARNLYKQEGLDIVLKEAPDHISVELEFMYFLALKEAEARENSDLEQAACLRDKQASFLRTHLGAWIQAFAGNIERNAQTDLYKAVGRATEHFVLKDLAGLSDIQASPEQKIEVSKES